jgi:hypothetical protein
MLSPPGEGDTPYTSYELEELPSPPFPLDNLKGKARERKYTL